ncbi:MAG: Lrp/AsnC family transcriptional regulator [Pseudomonadota bacterium]
MDRYDQQILQALRDDGRMSWSSLAQHIHLSASACQRRVEQLLQRGVIERFTIKINDAALGHGVKAFVAVNVERNAPDSALDFRNRIADHPMVQSVHMLAGNVDFLLEVLAADIEAFGMFVDTELLTMPGVRDATSSIVLKQIKTHAPVIPGG